MKRLAIFVEGHTEILFVEKLIQEIAGVHKVVFEHQQISGGARVPRRISVLRAASPTGQEEFYVLLIDCGGDHQVKPRIYEEHRNLTNAGYSKIIGIRDVRPNVLYSDAPILAADLRLYIDTNLIPVEFILAVMEIEAWFISEYTHFHRIDPSITMDLIRTSLGFDPAVDDMTSRPTPMLDLHNCYQLAGKGYQKPGVDTINALDYSQLYLETRNRIQYLDKLSHLIDEYLS